MGLLPLLEGDPEAGVRDIEALGPAFPYGALFAFALKWSTGYWQEQAVPWLVRVNPPATPELIEAAEHALAMKAASQPSRQALRRWLKYQARPTERHRCPVCRHAVLAWKPYERRPPPSGLTLMPPYEEQLGRPSYDVCSRCEFEFGNDDDPGTAEPVSFETYRHDWDEDDFVVFARTGQISGVGVGTLETDIAAHLGVPEDISVTRPVILAFRDLEVTIQDGTASLIKRTINRPSGAVRRILDDAGIGHVPVEELSSETQEGLRVSDSGVTIVSSTDQPEACAYASEPPPRV